MYPNPILVGWYLMLPPNLGEVRHPPLFDWYWIDSFDSAPECKQHAFAEMARQTGSGQCVRSPARLAGASPARGRRRRHLREFGQVFFHQMPLRRRRDIKVHLRREVGFVVERSELYR